MLGHRRSRAAQAILAGAVTASLAAYGLPAWAATAKTDNTAKPMTEDVGMSGGWASPQMARLAESAGHLLMQRINTAQGYIKAGKYEAAHNELDAAEDTAGAIRTMMPYVMVTDQIKGAKDTLTSANAEFFHDDLLPIYSQLDEMAPYAPLKAQTAKQQVKKAEQEASAGKTEEAKKDLDSAVATITATTVYLPVDYVYGQVASARIDLTGPTYDVAAANHAIQNAEKSVVAAAVVVDEQKLG